MLLDSRSTTEGRAIEVYGESSADRSLPDARSPISRSGDSSTVAGSSSNSDARWLSPLRDAISTRSFAGLLGSPSDAVTSGDNGAAIIPSVGSSAVAPIRRYTGNDPFSVLADIYSSLFGGDNPQAGTTQYSVVPQTVGGGGGNTAQIFLLLALAGVAVWWFYFRKKGQNAD